MCESRKDYFCAFRSGLLHSGHTKRATDGSVQWPAAAGTIETRGVLHKNNFRKVEIRNDTVRNNQKAYTGFGCQRLADGCLSVPLFLSLAQYFQRLAKLYRLLGRYVCMGHNVAHEPFVDWSGYLHWYVLSFSPYG